MNKEVKKIFLLLTLCSLADGFFYNFQQLWMQSNNLSIRTIGLVLSIASFLSISTIFICSNLIKHNKIKKFLIILISIKIFLIFLLFLLNGTGLNILIKFFIMIDFVIDVEIYACIYPMIAMIEKNNKNLALKGIIYEGFYYIAVIFSIAILGKTFGFITINYNIYLIISLIILISALIVLLNIKLEKYYDKVKNSKTDLNIMKKIIKIISENKSIKHYLLFQINNNISHSCLTRLVLLMLITTLNFEEKTASLTILFLGILSPLIGIITLKYITFDKEYINIFIKYGCRIIIYLIAFITFNKMAILYAIIYTKMFSSSYSHVDSAPYINMIGTKYQLAFCNFVEMCTYLGKSIGIFICGLLLAKNLRIIFIVCALFTFIGLYQAYKALYIRKKEVI